MNSSDLLKNSKNFLKCILNCLYIKQLFVKIFKHYTSKLYCTWEMGHKNIIEYSFYTLEILFYSLSVLLAQLNEFFNSIASSVMNEICAYASYEGIFVALLGNR